MALAYFLCQAMALVCFFPEKKIHKKGKKSSDHSIHTMVTRDTNPDHN